MTGNELVSKLVAQYPNLDDRVAVAVGEYVSRFKTDDIGKIWKRFDEDFEGKQRPDVGTFRGYAKAVGAISIHGGEGEITHYLLRCDACMMHREESPGPKCLYCGVKGALTIVVTNKSAGQLNLELYNRTTLAGGEGDMIKRAWETSLSERNRKNAEFRKSQEASR